MQYTNTDPLTNNEWIYTNETDKGQNLIVTLSGGDGALSKTTWIESNWTKYWTQGARGVSVQCFIGEVLQEVAQGGLGNPQSICDQKRWVRNEGYQCGRYWWGGVKWCDRAVYDWSYTNRAFPRGGSGDTKSFALNLQAGESLKIVFVGGANITNTLFNGSVNISLIPQTPPVIPEPQPEVEPEVPEPQNPEVVEPEIDSNENTESENTEQDNAENPNTDSSENTDTQTPQENQGQENTDTETTPQENTESENPPIVEPEAEQEQELTISVEMREEARKLTEAMQSYQTFLRENKDTIVAFGNMGDVSYQLAIKKKYSLPLDTFCDSKFLVDLPYIELWYGLPIVLGKFEQDMLDCGLIPYSELTFANELQELTYPQLLEIANADSVDTNNNIANQTPLTAEMINDFLAFIDNFNTFAISNPTIQIDESKDLTDHFLNLKSKSPAYTSLAYESGFKRLMLYEAVSFVLDDIIQSQTPELVEFFSTMPQTTYNNGDLKELSIDEMRQELQSLQAQSE